MTAGSLKVVFDTNILVSGHFWKGPPYRCLLAVEAGLATLVLSRRAMGYPCGICPARGEDGLGTAGPR